MHWRASLALLQSEGGRNLQNWCMTFTSLQDPKKKCMGRIDVPKYRHIGIAWKYNILQRANTLLPSGKRKHCKENFEIALTAIGAYAGWDEPVCFSLRSFPLTPSPGSVTSRCNRVDQDASHSSFHSAAMYFFYVFLEVQHPVQAHAILGRLYFGVY